MAYVELSLTEAGPAREIAGPAGEIADPAREIAALHRWVHPVSAAAEASVLIDADGVVVAASPACAAFFAIGPADALGRRLVGEVLRLVDFSAASDELPEWESERIAPVLALTSGAPARGLLRAVGPTSTYMLDAVTTPLREDETVVGSLTFFATVSGQ